jgi:hypothetical protein
MNGGYYGMNDEKDLKIWKFEDLKMMFDVLIWSMC